MSSTLMEHLRRFRPNLRKALEGLSPRERYTRIRGATLQFALFESDEAAAEIIPLMFYALDDTFLEGPTEEAKKKHPFTETPEVREVREHAKIARQHEARRLYDDLPLQPLPKSRELLLLEIIHRWGETEDEGERTAISDFLFSVEELFKEEVEIRVKALRQATDRENRTRGKFINGTSNGTLVAETYVGLACKAVPPAQAALHNDLVGALAYGVRQLLGLPPMAFRLYLPLLRLSRGPNRHLREDAERLACGLMDQIGAQQEALHELVEALTDHRERPMLLAEWIKVTYPTDPPQIGIANVRVEGAGEGNMEEWLVNFVEPVVRRVERWHKDYPNLTVTLTLTGYRGRNEPAHETEQIFPATTS